MPQSSLFLPSSAQEEVSTARATPLLLCLLLMFSSASFTSEKKTLVLALIDWRFIEVIYSTELVITDLSSTPSFCYHYNFAQVTWPF